MVLFVIVFYKWGVKKAALVFVGAIVFLFLVTVGLGVLSGINAEMSYAECLELESAEYCNDQLYDWCMENFNDQPHCLEYKECLDLSLNEELCTSQYFEFEG